MTAGLGAGLGGEGLSPSILYKQKTIIIMNKTHIMLIYMQNFHHTTIRIIIIHSQFTLELA